MKRRLVILCLVATTGVVPVLAQFRADIGLNVPWRFGVAEISIEEDAESESEWVNLLPAFLILPEVSISYAGEVGPVTVGGGIRGFTAVILSFLYPHVYAEMEFGPIVTGLSIGGGIFPVFGFLNSVSTAAVVVPDLKVHVKLGESFRLGGGAAAILGAGDEAGAPLLVYLSGIFVLDLQT